MSMIYIQSIGAQTPGSKSSVNYEVFKSDQQTTLTRTAPDVNNTDYEMLKVDDGLHFRDVFLTIEDVKIADDGVGFVTMYVQTLSHDRVFEHVPQNTEVSLREPGAIMIGSSRMAKKGGRPSALTRRVTFTVKCAVPVSTGIMWRADNRVPSDCPLDKQKGDVLLDCASEDLQDRFFDLSHAPEPGVHIPVSVGAKE